MTEETNTAAEVVSPEQDEKKRRKLLLALLLLLLLVCACLVLFVRYLLAPAPLPDLVPLPLEVNYAPHYLYSIYGVDQPVSVALSPDGKRLYVAETGGERMVKIISADSGATLGQFAAPNTLVGERAPVYLAIDPLGRIYLTDRLQHAIFIFDGDGNYLDSILSPSLSLSGFMASQMGGLADGSRFAYNNAQNNAWYLSGDGAEWTSVPAPQPEAWSPLGISITADGRLLVTDVLKDASRVIEYPSSITSADHWQAIPAPSAFFGAYGEGEGQFLFPNDVLVDSQERYYTIDGNNSRISIWNADRTFRHFFGTGTGESALNLPRGSFIDERDRLFIADAIGQQVKVYSVAGDAPEFLYAFGEMGIEDGLFNYPNDIVLSASGLIFIADRENNRVQVWAY